MYRLHPHENRVFNPLSPVHMHLHGSDPFSPCGRPHAVRKNDPSLEKKSFGIHKFPQIFYISSTKISDDHFWFFALKFQKFRHS